MKWSFTRLWRVTLASALVASLAACATPGSVPAEPSDESILSGRLSVRIASLDDAPGRSLSALFDLRSLDGHSGQLELSSPLGTLMGRAQWSPQQVRLSTPKGDYVYPDLSTLSEDLLGEQVPVQALFDWLHGRPWPDAHSTMLPPPSIGFSQLGWSIKLDRMDDGVITAERSTAPHITVLARIVR